MLQPGKAEEGPHTVGHEGGEEEPQGARRPLKGAEVEPGLSHLHPQGEEEDGDGRLAHEPHPLLQPEGEA